MNEQQNIPPNEMQLRAQLAAKIVAITTAIGKMIKDGQNKEQRYDFVSYEALNAKFRELLPEHKLALIPSITSIQERDLIKPATANQPEKLFTRSVIQGAMTIVDVETGYAMQCGFAGADNDNSGKSGGKAITEAIKRFEMKLFHVSTKDDIDPDTSGYPDYQDGSQQQGGGWLQGGHSQQGGGWPQQPTGQGGYR